jgi:hypothetical protein
MFIFIYTVAAYVYLHIKAAYCMHFFVQKAECVYLDTDTAYKYIYIYIQAAYAYFVQRLHMYIFI